MKALKILLLVTVAGCSLSCNPLKKIHRTEKTETLVHDQTEIRKILSELINEQMKVRQRVIEFFPPAVFVQSDDAADAITTAPSELTEGRQPVKRIIYTEIDRQTETQKDVDSTAKNDIKLDIREGVDERIDEKPPPAVQGTKWTTLGLLVIFLILLFLKWK